MDGLKEFLKKEFIKISLSTIIKCLIGSFITTSTLVAVFQFLMSKVTYLNEYKWYFFLIAISAGVWVFIFIYDKYFLYKPDFPPIDPEFKILEKDIFYEYKDMTHMIYRKRLLLLALKNNLNRFEHRYRWSGKGKLDIKCTKSGQQYIETIKKNIWQYYDIRFERTLKKREKIEIEIEFKLDDIEMKARPFLATTIEEPTKYLLMRVKLPHEFGVKQAICEVSTHIGARLPLRTHILDFDKNEGIVQFKENNPPLLYNYEIKWDL